MKERKRRQSLGGAVLIMVLTVMFILMILLMAAMTTVSTANQRIFTKFEENQAYYTARSALDVFVQNMVADKKYIAYNDGGNKVAYKYGDNKTADMKQGLGLQIDIYSITAQNGMNIKQSDLVTAAGNISVAADKKDEYKYYFGADPSINEIYYEVELPKTADASKAYGMLSDRVGGESKAKIKIEVLKRKYDVGTYSFTTGSHNGTDIKTFLETLSDDDLTKFFSTDITADEAKDVAMAIIKGNRKKDTMQLKITATTMYRGVEGTAVLIIDSNEPPVNNSSNALTTFGQAGSDNMRIVGGASSTDDVKWSNTGYVYGSVYAEKDYTINTGAELYLAAGETLIIGNDLKIDNVNFKVLDKSLAGTAADNKPFIYVGGKLISGNLSNPPFSDMDLITHGIEVTGNGFHYNNDVYCVGDIDLKSANAFNVGGNLYVQGNIYATTGDSYNFSSKIQGDGSKTYTVSGITGMVYINGNIYDSQGALATDNFVTASGGKIQKVTENFTADGKIPAVADLKKPNADKAKLDITMPVSNTTKHIPTHAVMFSDYYVTDSDGDVVDASGNKITSSGNPPANISAEAMAEVTGFSKSDIGATTEISSISTTDISSGTYMGFKQIDTAGAGVKCYLKTGTDYGKYYFTGGGTVEVVLDPTGNANNGTTIVVDSDSKTTLKVYGPKITGSDYSFWHFYVYNNETYEAQLNKTVLNVGDKSGNDIVVPNIYYYFSNGTKVHFYNGDVHLTGYVYAPGTDFSANDGGKVKFKLKYNGVSVKGGNEESMTVIGSFLGKSIKFDNSNGVAYINPDLDDDTPGEPIHQWQSFQYIRG